MVRFRGVSLLLTLLSVSAVLVSTVQSNSTGAPETAAKDGCTCHGAMDAAVTVALDGVPASYQAGQTYGFTLRITGGPMPIPAPAGAATGGFAVEASEGKFVAGTGTQVTSDLFITHNAAGNDQRSWTFQWSAPANATGNVTFWWAANAVNGDRANTNELDQWNKSMKVVAPAAANGTTSPSASPAKDDTPSWSAPLVAALLVGAAAMVRLRKP